MTTPHDHIRIEGCYRCVLPEDDPAFIMSETNVYRTIEDLRKKNALLLEAVKVATMAIKEAHTKIKELEELVDHQLEVMNDGTIGAGFILDENAKLKAEIERLEGEAVALAEIIERMNAAKHTPTCACQLCIQAYGPVDSR